MTEGAQHTVEGFLLNNITTQVAQEVVTFAMCICDMMKAFHAVVYKTSTLSILFTHTQTTQGGVFKFHLSFAVLGFNNVVVSVVA